jgi:hypothetical protein
VNPPAPYVFDATKPISAAYRATAKSWRETADYWRKLASGATISCVKMFFLQQAEIRDQYAREDDQRALQLEGRHS